MIRITTIFCTGLLLAGPAISGELPGVENVLGRFIEAVGGAEALNAIDERHYRGTIIQDLSRDDPQRTETPFIAAADVAGNVRYAETRDWSKLPVGDADELPSKLRWILHPRFALVVEDFFPGLSVERREVRDGRNVVVLVPRDLKPEYYSLYFDEETGLLNHVGYHNELEDWRELGGVLHPHRWVFGRKGGHTTYVWQEVIVTPVRR